MKWFRPLKVLPLTNSKTEGMSGATRSEKGYHSPSPAPHSLAEAFLLQLYPLARSITLHQRAASIQSASPEPGRIARRTNSMSPGRVEADLRAFRQIPQMTGSI